MMRKIKSFLNIISPIKYKMSFSDKTLEMIDLYDDIQKNFYKVFENSDPLEQEFLSTQIDNFTYLFESPLLKEDRNDFLYYLRINNQETKFLDIFPGYKHIAVASFIYFGIKDPKLNKKSSIKIS